MGLFLNKLCLLWSERDYDDDPDFFPASAHHQSIKNEIFIHNNIWHKQYLQGSAAKAILIQCTYLNSLTKDGAMCQLGGKKNMLLVIFEYN